MSPSPMTPLALSPAPATPVPEPDGPERSGEVFAATVARLNRQSVDRHFDAYVDVAWDDPAMSIDPTDERWILPHDDPLAATDWYRAQPPDIQARIGLQRVATSMRTGWEFENVLQRGLLTVAFRLPDGASELRYLHHEVIEESQHTLMFQEFVGRTGFAVRGLPWHRKLAAELLVIPLARIFPPLFFLFVLGGEDPIDHVQRQRLRAGVAHPLVERIMRIHVTEEARHLSFARHYLKREVPNLGPLRRHLLAVAAPVLLGIMARQMLAPTPAFARSAGIPRSVARHAGRSAQARDLFGASVRKVRRLCAELGLITPVAGALWRALGIWESPTGDAAADGSQG